MTDLPSAPGPGGPVGPGSDERNLAMATHVGTAIAVVVGGWFVNVLVPLGVWLWQRERSPFVRQHALEELNFQISLTIYAVVAFVVTVLTLGLGLLLIIPIALLLVVVVVYTMVRASIAGSRGEPYRYPLTMRLVR